MHPFVERPMGLFSPIDLLITLIRLPIGLLAIGRFVVLHLIHLVLETAVVIFCLPLLAVSMSRHEFRKCWIFNYPNVFRNGYPIGFKWSDVDDFWPFVLWLFLRMFPAVGFWTGINNIFLWIFADWNDEG
jgi:hypothetical protein